MEAAPDTPGEEERFRALLDKIYRDIGLDCSRFKENYLRRRIAVRMRALGVGDYGEYARMLDGVPGEYALLKDRITVNVTEFFRDPDVYAFMRSTVVPGLLEKKRREEPGLPRLTVWSAGCSSGEEPYTLAMLLDAHLRRHAPEHRLHLVATDLDETVLERARAGLYPKAALAKVAAEFAGRYFVQQDGHMRVTEELRRLVSFQRHNLFSDPPPSPMDLVVCRNVMIYFSKDLQQRLLQAFHKALVPGGTFVLGKTESLLGSARQLFRCVSTKERVFVRL